MGQLDPALELPDQNSRAVAELWAASESAFRARDGIEIAETRWQLRTFLWSRGYSVAAYPNLDPDKPFAMSRAEHLDRVLRSNPAESAHALEFVRLRSILEDNGAPVAQIRAAQLDTAVHTGHPMIRDRVEDPWNVVTESTEMVSGRFTYHGTGVASLILAGADDGVSLVPIQIFPPDEAGGVLLETRADAVADLRQFTERIVSGIRHAVDSGSRTINLSITLPELASYERFTPSLEPIVDEAVAAIREEIQSHPSVAFFFGSGNANADLNETAITMRPLFVLPNVTAVAAARLGPRGQWHKHGTSNYGAPWITLAATGGVVASPEPDDAWGKASESSFGLARATGLAARCLALCPWLTPEQLQKLLVATSARFSVWSNINVASGPIDERRALRLAAYLALTSRDLSEEDAARELGFSAAERRHYAELAREVSAL